MRNSLENKLVVYGCHCASIDGLAGKADEGSVMHGSIPTFLLNLDFVAQLVQPSSDV